MSPTSASDARPGRAVVMVCIAAMVALAVAMGVGRFAFTPLFPLMISDGLLSHDAGALLAVSNYIGYFVGALLAARLKTTPATLMTTGLIGTVIVTAAVGWTVSVTSWTLLRCMAGVMSAWTLVATSAWSLEWLASFKRPDLAGVVFAGVGLGITAVGLFCLITPVAGVSSLMMWTQLAFLTAPAVLIPLAVSWRMPVPFARTERKYASPDRQGNVSSRTTGLIVCYTLFGFGYILPATYLPVLARQLVEDPRIFGLAWPVFGIAAALSTVIVAWGLRKSNRLNVWAASHVLMAIGVLLPSMWFSLFSLIVAALLVGSTFVVINMLGMQEVRARTRGNATPILGRMTAGFALGQLIGPVVPVTIARFAVDYATALLYALALAAAGLLASAVYLWREGGNRS